MDLATQVTATALLAQGQSCIAVAKQLGVSRSTVWRLRHQDLLDPELVQHASKSLADKTLLGATAAIDTFLDQAQNGELSKCHPLQLAKAVSVLAQSSGAYAALTGAQDTFAKLAAEYGIEPSHSVSRLTVTKQVSIESK